MTLLDHNAVDYRGSEQFDIGEQRRELTPEELALIERQFHEDAKQPKPRVPTPEELALIERQAKIDKTAQHIRDQLALDTERARTDPKHEDKRTIVDHLGRHCRFALTTYEVPVPLDRGPVVESIKGIVDSAVGLVREGFETDGYYVGTLAREHPYASTGESLMLYRTIIQVGRVEP